MIFRFRFSASSITGQVLGGPASTSPRVPQTPCGMTLTGIPAAFECVEHRLAGPRAPTGCSEGEAQQRSRLGTRSIE
jgi:hypothetical protein